MRVAGRAVKRILASRWGWRIALAARTPGVAVLTYHRVGTPDDVFPCLDVGLFRSHMRWLRENCVVIAPEEVREHAGRSDGRRPTVAVTFDDGYRGFHDHAYPVLRELGIPAAVFLATRFMDEGGLAWWDTLYLAVRRTRARRAALPWAPETPFDLAEEGGREGFLRACKRHLKSVPEVEKERWLGQILRSLEVERELDVDRQMLTWSEVGATVGLIRYGGHTHTHAILSRVDRARMEQEIRTCRDRIEAETGVAPHMFAYPNGQPGDFTEECKAVLRRHGFEIAFATGGGFNREDTDWMEIQRIAAAGPLPEFAWRLARVGQRRPHRERRRASLPCERRIP
jgi:peptidoglycan/xylan/chitin deacetylase (PgdA/CDA1 family)